MSVTDIQQARGGLRRGELEANRWGVLLSEATAARSAVQRGTAGAAPGDDLVDAFERFVVPVTRDGDAVTGPDAHDRTDRLGYLAGVGFELPASDFAADRGSPPADGPGTERADGSVQFPDFFTYASQFGGDLGSFVDAFETFATAEGSSDSSGVTSAFETTVDAAMGAAPGNPTPLAELIELLTAGVRAAHAHRESFEDQLTNDFDDGNRTAVGLLQQYHDGLAGSETAYPEALFETLDEHPIAMLPVAVETSFHEVETDDRSGRELRVRVYPDDVHVDTHEPELTTQEERWGKVFWTQVYTGRFHRTQPDSDPPLPKATVTERVPDDVAEVAERTLWADSGRDGTRFADFSADVGSRYEEIKERAWELLIERAGRERAAYVVRRTEPVVDGSEDDGSEFASDILAGPPEGPDATTANENIDDLAFTDVANRPDTWTRQPRARYLPGRWLVRLEWTDDDGLARSAWTNAEYTVDQPLYVGPDPSSVELARSDRDTDGEQPGTRTEEETPNSAVDAVDAGMEWMVDFEEARRRGMALRIAPADIGTSTLPDHFDRVTVTGVRASTTPAAATEEIAELFAHQQYTEGLELLPSGTPTNNHDGGKSAYRREEPPEESLEIEVDEPLTGATDPSDGTLLAQCLGLPTADDHVFAHVEGADEREWLDERHLQSVLWAGTLGYTLKQLLLPDAIYGDSATDAEIEAAEERHAAIRDHVFDYVRTGGPFPALRIGDQPYGVLPAMSLDAGDASGGDPSDGAALVRRIVQFLRPFWRQSEPEVPTIDDDVPTGEGAGTTAIDPIRRVLQRGAVGDAYTRRLFLEDRRGRSHRLTRALSEHGVDYDPRVARLKEFRPESSGRHSEYGHGEFESIPVGGDVADAPGRQISIPGLSGSDPEESDDGGSGAETGGYGTDRPSLITTVARPDPQDAFLSALPRMINSDLVKFGMEPHFERFPGLVPTAYHDQAPITSWEGLSGILEDDVHGPVKEWLKGDALEPRIALARLVDKTGVDVFIDHTAGGFMNLAELSSEIAGPVVEHVLTGGSDDGLDFDIDSVPQEKLVAALELLYVDALDEWVSLGVDFGSTSGQLYSMSSLSGSELTASRLEELEGKLLDLIRPRIRRTDIDWPEGADRIRLFYEGAVEATLPENPEENQRKTEIAYNRAEVLGERLLRKHLADYVVIATTIHGSSSEHFPHIYLKEAGENIIPTPARKVEQGDRPTFEAKRIHDTALFPQLLRFSTINAGLDGLASTDAESYQFSPRDILERDGGGDGRYDLLTNITTASIYEAWGYQSNARHTIYDEIVDGFGATRWNGLLNAMRYRQFVGKPEVDDRFQAFQASLEYLADEQWLAPDRIDRTRRLVSGTLDLASHRLDAWWTSLATRRLMELRGAEGDGSFDIDFAGAWVNTQPEAETDRFELDWSTVTLETPTGNTATYVGAYGFVEDLVRDGVTLEADTDAAGTDSAPDEGDGVSSDDDGSGADGSTITATDVGRALTEAEWLETPPTDGGTGPEAEYIQAPSLPQATTAAILRSGHRSEPTTGFSDTLAIDLSPRRVQKAQWVLDGLRSGLWLGELMGYYFERRLHEVSEDVTGVSLETYIADFREYVPFRGDAIDHDEGSDGSGTDATESGSSAAGGSTAPGAKYDLVDGYELYRRTSERSIDAVLDEVQIPEDPAVRAWTAQVLGEVDEILDALSDLVVAENVHQLQQGNFGQAGRSLKALSEGKHPRRPEVLETKRDSVGVTHRLLVLFGLDGDPPGSGTTVRPGWVPDRQVTVPSIAEDGSLSLDGNGVPETTTADTVVRDDGAPVLNAFAGGLFPDPTDVRCGATYRWEVERDTGDSTDDPSEGGTQHDDGDETETGNGNGNGPDETETGNGNGNGPDDGNGNGNGTDATDDGASTSVIEHEVAVSGGIALADLNLSPLDGLYLTQQSGEAGQSKLENHVAYYLLRHRDEHGSPETPIPADAELDVTFADLPPDAPDDAMTFGEFVEHARSLQDLVLDARPADATDLGHPGDEIESERIDAGPVVDRARTATDRLRQIRDVLDNRLDVVGTAGTSDTGGQQAGERSGESGDGEAEGEIVPPVDRMETALEALDEAMPLSSVASAAGGLAGSELRSELHTLLDHLPAGPTSAAAAPEPTLIEPGSATITLDVFDGEPDAFVSPSRVKIAGTHDGDGQAGSVEVTDPSTGQSRAAAVPSGSEGFDVTIDLEEFVRPPASTVRPLRVGITAGTGEITAIEGATPTDVSEGAGPLLLGLVPDPAAVAAFADGSATLDVEVASDSPSSRFRASAAEVELRSDGTCEVSFDATGVQVGTRFTAVATFTDDSGVGHVAATTEGRVVGADPANAIDDSLLSSMDSLPRLLWLAGFAEPMRVREDETGISLATGILSAGAVRSTVRRRLPESATAAGEFGTSGTGTSGILPGSQPESGGQRGGESGRQGSSGQQDGGRGGQRGGEGGRRRSDGESSDGRTDDGPTPAQRLHRALGSVPWDAIDRERELFPSANTTYDQPKREAVAALTDCGSVDLVTASDALTGTPNDRGLAPLVDLLALRDAITVVGRTDPFGQQTHFAPDEPVGLADARARIEAFLDDPWPGARQWADPDWLLVDSALVAFVLDRGVGDAFDAFLSLVTDPAWTPANLDPLVTAPGDLVAAVDDLLYHPDAPNRESTLTTVVTGLEQIVTEVGSGGGPGLATLERFESVSDLRADVAEPLRTLVGTLRGASLSGPGDGTATFDSTVADWRNALTSQCTPLAEALAGADLTTSLREGLLETLRRPMVRAAYFGVYGAMPAAASGGTETDRENLARQAAATLETVEDRLPAEADPPADLDGAIDRLETVFGEEYTVLPPFSPGNLAEVTRTFGNGDLLRDDDASPGPLPVQTWLQRAARVRERPGMLRETLLYGEIATGKPRLRFDVGQLPHDPDDSWVGLDGVRPGGRDRVSLVAHTDGGFDDLVAGTTAGPSRTIAGIHVDEWVERVPAQEETTGVAVRYDEPDNEAPQSILLATPPVRSPATADDDRDDTADDPETERSDDQTTGDADGSSPWSLSAVGATFDETFEMTRARGVTLEDLRPEGEQDRWMLGKLLPALYFAQDTHLQPNTPSLDLTSLSVFEDLAGDLLLSPWLFDDDLPFARPRVDLERYEMYRTDPYGTGGLGVPLRQLRRHVLRGTERETSDGPGGGGA